MKPSVETPFAERQGQALGRMWRGYLRHEQKVNGWLVEHRVPAGVATALLWIVKLAILGVLLYVAFWLVLLLLFAVVAASVASQATGEEDTDFLGREAEERDHRESLFYHPVSYNDDPDPRFDDD